MKSQKARIGFLLILGIIFFGVLVLPNILPFIGFSDQGINFSPSKSVEEKREFRISISDRKESQENSIHNSPNNNQAKTEPKPVILLSRTVHRGDTLYDLLKDAPISPQKRHYLLQSLKSMFPPRDCKPGHKVELQKPASGECVTLKYFPGGLNYYVVEEIKPGEFSVSTKRVPGERVLVGAKGTIRSSLYESMRKRNINIELILKFAEIFSWEIDFLTDPRRGDSFQIIWERYVDSEGKILQEGRILAAQYANQERKYTALFYRNPDGEKGYFTPGGKSLRRSFLRSPLDYRRISSYFSYRRFHPILKIYRPHLGIDYAAPTGTPVSTIGDGTVIFAGWKGGFGRFVQIKHPNGYITSYGHLSRIAREVRKGRRVNQGQVIGYVGSTGLSTGPHLDFRISKNGKFLNFLKLDFPRATPVKKAYMDEFNQIKEKYVYYLNLLSETSQDFFVFHREPFGEEVTSRLSSSPSQDIS